MERLEKIAKLILISVGFLIPGVGTAVMITLIIMCMPFKEQDPLSVKYPALTAICVFLCASIQLILSCLFWKWLGALGL